MHVWWWTVFTYIVKACRNINMSIVPYHSSVVWGGVCRIPPRICMLEHSWCRPVPDRWSPYAREAACRYTFHRSRRHTSGNDAAGERSHLTHAQHASSEAHSSVQQWEGCSANVTFRTLNRIINIYDRMLSVWCWQWRLAHLFVCMPYWLVEIKQRCSLAYHSQSMASVLKRLCCLRRVARSHWQGLVVRTCSMWTYVNRYRTRTKTEIRLLILLLFSINKTFWYIRGSLRCIIVAACMLGGPVISETCYCECQCAQQDWK